VLTVPTSLRPRAQAAIFSSGGATPGDSALLNTALRMRDMGRLLMATEIRSMLTYWHVQAPEDKSVARVYPGKTRGIISLVYCCIGCAIRCNGAHILQICDSSFGQNPSVCHLSHRLREVLILTSNCVLRSWLS
jgi:hypothetical protein